MAQKIKTNSDGSVNVITMVVSPSGATFYTDAGQAINIAAGDPRVTELIAKVQGHKNLSTSNPVRVNFTTFEVFDEFEKKTGIRFFRVLKKAVKGLLGMNAERGEVEAGGFVSDVTEDTPPKPQPGTSKITQDQANALAKHHAEVSGAKIEDTTVVAVVDDTPIVGAEALEGHTRDAVRSGNTAGMEAFYRRLAKVAQERKHTAQELLAFMKKNDLPVADDGCIIAYKSLTVSGDSFVDNHSKSLRQNVGTVVKMDVEMVDDNRRVACSNGLHIARKGYLGGYGTGSNNGIFIAKIRPEMVISVPMGEQDKMRVAEYFLVDMLNDTERQNLSQGKHIDDGNSEIGKLLGRVISGDHIAPMNLTHQNRSSKQIRMQPLSEQDALVYTGFYHGHPMSQPSEPSDAILGGSRAVRMARTIRDMYGNRDPNAKLDPASINKTLNTREADEVGQDDLDAAAEFHDKLVENGGTNEGMGTVTGRNTSDTPNVEEVEPERVDVWITDAGKNKITLIRVIREIFRLGLKEAKEISEGMSHLRHVTRVQADKLVKAAAQSEGSKVIIQKMDEPKPQPEAKPKPVKTEPKAPTKSKETGKPKTKATGTKKTKPTPPKKAGPTLADEARTMFNAKKFADLMAFKKKKKKSWQVLGFSEKEVATITGKK